MMKTKIGQLIKEEVERQGLTADQFAALISTSRTNVYHIFNRDNIDMELLIRISNALHRNFFTEMYKEMATMLGAAEPPATWANMKLQSLTHPLREKFEKQGMRLLTTSEWTKEREKLKEVLREYFRSEHRMPLLILESGYTFGAREVVKQVAAEEYRSCGSAPCPKLIDVAKVKAMPEKVLIDYIDKNTFDSVSESDRRLNELCYIQKEVTKKFVCIIHTDPTPFILEADNKNFFDLWGGEEQLMLTRYEKCFITVYHWNRRSLLSWAKDTRQHEYVVNFIQNHRIEEGSAVDYQISHAYVSNNYRFIGGPATYENVDYPTAHAYSQNDWEYVSKFFRENGSFKDEFILENFIEEIRDFNEPDNNNMENQIYKKLKCSQPIECHIEVDGYLFECEKIKLPKGIKSILSYLYHFAKENDLKGLEEETFEDSFYPWLKQHHPKVAQAIEDAADRHLADQLSFDPEGVYRDNIPYVAPTSIEEGWAVADGVEYNFIFYDLPVV